MSKDDEVRSAAEELSRRGASRGGRGRAERMTAEERSEASRKSAQARWAKSAVFAPYVGSINFGSVSIDCAVLPDDRRGISQTSMDAAFGRTGGARRGTGAERLPLLSPLNIRPLITTETRQLAENPVEYRGPGGEKGLGYPAELLPKLCSLYSEAREQGLLRPKQMPIAAAAEVLMRGLAETAIVALVDEATGFQDVRAKNALAEILEAFIDQELQAWVKTFPDDYYEQLFSLRGLEFPHGTVKRPSYFGHLTNDIVYKRLAPGVLDELKRITVRDSEGVPKHKFHQRLTQSAGYPKLREHLASVVTIMKLSSDYQDFENKLDQVHPRYGDTIPLALEWGEDSGKGF